MPLMTRNPDALHFLATSLPLIRNLHACVFLPHSLVSTDSEQQEACLSLQEEADLPRLLGSVGGGL